MENIIFHIDVNSAFLAWEAAYRLRHLGGTVDLRELDAIVGGDQDNRHGIVLAKSISAKQYGVQTGESIMEAKRKCPHLTVVPPHYKLYDKCSQAFMDILREYSPDVEPYSIDESFMDMTGTRQLWGEPVAIANIIRERISQELGFTVNVGISSNKLLAKMASDFKKPNLVHTLYPKEVPDKLWPLPVSELFFVGRATAKKLYLLDIHTIGDLANADLAMLKQSLKSHGEVIWNYANGRDVALVESTAAKNKGYGNSTTVAFDVTDSAVAQLILLSLAETVGMRLRKDNVKIEVVAVEIKYFDFQHASHQKTLAVSTNITNEIYQAAAALLHEIWDHQTPIRLLGISTARVREQADGRQLSLFDLPSTPLPSQGPAPGYEKLQQLDAAIDTIRHRYGVDAVQRASFLHNPEQISHVNGGILRTKHSVDYSQLDVE